MSIWPRLFDILIEGEKKRKEEARDWEATDDSEDKRNPNTRVGGKLGKSCPCEGHGDSALKHHTIDIVMFDVPAPLQAKGIKEYEKTWELFFDNSPGGSGSFDVTELKVTASETVAYCHALVKVFDLKVRLTHATAQRKRVNG